MKTQFFMLVSKLFGFCLLMAYFINTGLADPGNLVNTPLFTTTNNTPPNVFFEVDDSGSMDWEVLTKIHWSRCAYKYTTSCSETFEYLNSKGVLKKETENQGRLRKDGLFRGQAYKNDSGVYRYTNFYYLFNNSDNSYSPSHCTTNGASVTLEVCELDSQREEDWRIRSSSLNVAYYNPSIVYSPWVIGDGNTLSNASFTQVKSNPQPNSDGVGLKKNLNGFIYHVWIDSHGFSHLKSNGKIDTNPRPRSIIINRTLGANKEIDWWDEHLRYTVNASSIIVDKITYTGDGTVETVTHEATLSGGGGHSLLGGKTVVEAKQNIANWYQYFRKRSFVAKSAIAKVISENPFYRYGLNFINDSTFKYNNTNTSLIKVPETKGTKADNAKIIQSIFDLKWPTKKTPLRKGLERAGEYFRTGNPSPITETCQKSFTILFTDGYWNGIGANSPSSSIGDADGDQRQTLDGTNVTVADVAEYYYSNDLSSLKDYQNMVTFTVAFGVSGELVDSDGDGDPDPVLTKTSSEWTGANTYNRKTGNLNRISDLKKIDDLWHAAFNSTGTFVSAETPEEVAKALENALANIGNRVGSASSAAFSTTTLKEDSAVYLAQFDTTGDQWTGDIKSFGLTVEDKGKINLSLNWSASEKLDVKPENTRNIFTYDKSEGEGIPFLWDKLASSQQDDLRINPDGSSSNASDDAKAKERLNFLRGDDSNEENENGTKKGDYSFKYRQHLLGDIIHSAPVFVQKPKLFWPSSAKPFPTAPGQTYKDFKESSAKTRMGVVYAGANDGMLHGFDSSTGNEVLAYIPNSLFTTEQSNGLHFLTDTNYAHRYYVDMPITVSDAYINKGGSQTKKWRTVLIGGGRKGSRGLFALDITNPTKFEQTTTNAQDLVLWEFDQTDDADLGFTFSQPTVARMNNGRWAAIFGNGYNNTGDGSASLFIVFLDAGADGQWQEGASKDYIKITTKVGSNKLTNCDDCNGLSSPQTVDMDADKVVDRIYAGDLKGNMWVFDVSSTNANSWGVTYGTKQSPKPLFTAIHNNKPQPITNKPTLVKHPEGIEGNEPNVLVFFGTGQYLVETDPSNTDVQSFYGVWDNGKSSSMPLTPSNLVEQNFLSGAFINDSKNVSGQVRVLTDNKIDYSEKQGWVINLTLKSGERMIVDPDIRGDLVFFNTWIPNSDACSSGGSGFLMVVKQINGGTPDEAVFDFNGDGKIDSDDLVIVDGKALAPSGLVFNLGLPSSSSFLGNIRVVTGTDNGGDDDDDENNMETGLVIDLSGAKTGRLSWQELRQ